MKLSEEQINGIKSHYAEPLEIWGALDYGVRMRLKHVQSDIPALLGHIKALESERAEFVRYVRGECADYGDNDWPDNLHLVDVVEKHLLRYVLDK